jgi:hypothetical protein
MEAQVENTTTQQVCSIQIAFVVDSDETAIRVKRSVEAALQGVTTRRMTFQINSMGQRTMPDSVLPRG